MRHFYFLLYKNKCKKTVAMCLYKKNQKTVIGYKVTFQSIFRHHRKILLISSLSSVPWMMFVLKSFPCTTVNNIDKHRLIQQHGRNVSKKKMLSQLICAHTKGEGGRIKQQQQKHQQYKEIGKIILVLEIFVLFHIIVHTNTHVCDFLPDSFTYAEIRNWIY